MRLTASEYDPETGFTEEFWFDEQTGKVTINRIQDVEGTIEANRATYMGASKDYSDSKGGAHLVARIPLVIIEKWLREDGFDWFNSTDKERRAILNKAENKFLKVRPGTL
jgi:hypothetical protein